MDNNFILQQIKKNDIVGNFKIELRKNGNDNFELTEQELKELILKSYNEGYQNCKTKIKNIVFSFDTNLPFNITSQWLTQQKLNQRSILDEI